MLRAGWILMPSLLFALAAEAVFFAIFDPVDLSLVWQPLGPNRIVAYAQGLLLFWVFTAASSGFTLFLQRSSGEASRLCPLEPSARPEGCPKREEPQSQWP